MTAIAGIQQFGRSSEGETYLSTRRSLFIANIKRDKGTENVIHIKKTELF
jgi:hypothetical protein